ncbi:MULTISPECIES: hypothetical protein [unclassified Saccharothrix]|uniref:hypothetical protein n=1 Tax=unclassified Saccharothrix TaxID=2593673 RepID=UPI00307D2FCF
MTGAEASRIVQIGVLHGDLVVPAADPVETAYHRQVARLAPPRLLDRADELAELARFCTSPDTAGAYRWWQAGPWSGKTALLAWFALHPPPGVRVVSFFVTGRHAAQNDRDALVENLLEQLLALLGRALPALLTESTREAHLLDLLARAADLCRRRGEHLVLLVDGIDEDRGVTDGPDAHSIAALLPVHPPDGLRVVVAGRPEPPVPPDVPAHHPLRRPEVVRPLAGCAAARVEQADLVRELRVLLAAERTADLVGLLTAAGGGLAAADLAELTGRSRREVDDLLGTVAARSLSRRDGRHHPERTVFLLAHEELHREAVELLGPARLSAHLDRVHTWAATYRARGWPEDTPEYLLSGYFARSIETGDAAAFTACATDPSRHARLLAVSGGDAAALAEVVRAQRELASGRTPPVVDVARLAVHRLRLRSRIRANHPIGSPVLWAVAGRLDRARALAESTDEAQRPDALLLVVEAAARHGHLAWAAGVADGLPVHRHRVHALERVIRAAADSGHPDFARALLERVGSPGHGADVTPSLVRSLLAVGVVDRARALAESIPSDRRRDQARLLVVEALCARGEPAAAAEVVGSMAHERDRAWAAVTRACAGRGEAERAEECAARIEHPETRDTALVDLVRGLVGHGAPDRVEAVARRVPDPVARGRALLVAAEGWRAAGRPDRVRALVEEVDGWWRPGAERPGLAVVAVEAAIASGDPERARSRLAEVVGSTTFAHRTRATGRALTGLLRAARALDDGEVVARCVEAVVSSARSTAGDQWDLALSLIAQAAAEAGALGHARDLAVAVAEPAHRDRALSAVVAAAVAAREPDLAEHLVTEIRDPAARTRALTAVVSLAVAAGDHERASATLRRCEDVARADADAASHARLAAALLGTTTTTGDPDPKRALRRLRQAALREVERDPLRARRMLARYLVDEDRPEHLVTAVRRVAPEALAAIADEAARRDPPPAANA